MISLLVSSCTYRKEKESDFIVSYNQAMLDKVSYQLINQRILIPNCISCHDSSDNVNLETYSSVYGHIDKINQVTILNRKMPKSPYPALSKDKLELLATWIHVGAPEKPLDGSDLPPVEVEPLEPKFSSIKKNIFQNKCFICHSAGKEAERVSLSSPDDMIKSPLEIVIPGNPDESGLILSILPGARKIMPPKKSGIANLKADEIEIIKQWIANGAKD
ncbi:MAG: c-type cytochrome domain-containing protein [Bacteriovorax sp.]